MACPNICIPPFPSFMRHFNVPPSLQVQFLVEWTSIFYPADEACGRNAAANAHRKSENDFLQGLKSTRLSARFVWVLHSWHMYHDLGKMRGTSSKKNYGYDVA